MVGYGLLLFKINLYIKKEKFVTTLSHFSKALARSASEDCHACIYEVQFFVSLHVSKLVKVCFGWFLNILFLQQMRTYAHKGENILRKDVSVGTNTFPPLLFSNLGPVSRNSR